MSTTERVRLGAVGLGFMGHAHATNPEQFGHEVVAGADVVDETREEFAAMYDAEDLDAVAVSTRTPSTRRASSPP
nr:hypothetical protein [Natronolimnobius sp. AArcel1]